MQKCAEEIIKFLQQPNGFKNNPLLSYDNPLKEEIIEYLVKNNQVIHNIIKNNATELEMPYAIAYNFPCYQRQSESPNEIYIAEACIGGIIEIYNRQNKTRHFLEDKQPLIVRLQWSSDSEILLSELNNDTTSLWHIKTGELRSLPYSAMRYNPNMTHLVGGTKSGDVVLLDAQTYEVVKIFKGHTDWVRNICWSPDGKYVASGSFDKTIRIWHVATGRSVLSWPMSGRICYLEWNKNKLVAADEMKHESPLYKWNMENILALRALNEDQILLFELLKDKHDKLNTVKGNDQFKKIVQSLPEFIKKSFVAMNIVPHLLMTIKDGKQEIPLPAK